MKKQLEYRFEDRILLPEELVLEILLWLPVMSLLRFRSVCNDWKSLISSSSFRNMHRERHNSSSPLFLTCHGSKHEHDMLYDWYLTTWDLYGKIVQQCILPISSGNLQMMNLPSQSKLLCFHEKHDKRIIHSYNPSTRQLFRLPDPPCSSLPLQGYLYLNILSTYGYIASKDEYMFVLLVYNHPLLKWECEVLTFTISKDNNFELQYNEWRSIKSTAKVHIPYDGVYVCGAFYWQAQDDKCNILILSFDVETEVFSTFELPQGVPFNQFLELNDELYLMDRKICSLTFELWKLSTDVNNNKSWTLHWNINLQSLGYTKHPWRSKFDWKILIYRLEYLYSYKEPVNVEMAKLMPEDVVLEEDEEYLMPDWRGILIHSNLFTL